jgi:ATP-dependent RNA helicase DDX5/DBP2
MSNLGNSLARPQFDLSTLPRFEKNFYQENATVTNRSQADVDAFRSKHEMTLYGPNIPKPVETFDEAGFPRKYFTLMFVYFSTKIRLFFSY